MKILSKLFGRTKSKLINQPTISEPKETLNLKDQNVIPEKELFIESEEPFIEDPKPQKISKISRFLNFNFYSLGVQDGYQYHSSDHLIIGKRKISAEFRLILDQEIQEKEETQLQLENLITDVSAVSPVTLKKLETTLNKLNSTIEKLEKQKALSVDEDGWVMNAIHGYHQGFSQGLTDFIESEKLINSIKHL